MSKLDDMFLKFYQNQTDTDKSWVWIKIGRRRETAHDEKTYFDATGAPREILPFPTL